MPTPINIYPHSGQSAINWASRYGPFRHGNDLYAFIPLSSVEDPFSPPKIGVRKSSDGGLTWAAQDIGNTPQTAAKGCYYPGTGNILYLAYIEFTTRNLTLNTFNMSTDKYGTPITGGPHETGDGSNLGTLVWPFFLSNNTWVIVYDTGSFNFSTLRVKAVTYNGSWGSPFIVSTEAQTGVGAETSNALIDPSDRIYVYYNHYFPPATKTDLMFNNIIAGAAGTPAVISAGFNSNQSRIETGAGSYIASSNELIVAFQQINSGGAFHDLTVVRCTASATPSFMVQPLASGNTNDLNLSPGIIESSFSAGVGVIMNGAIVTEPFYYIKKTTGGSAVVLRAIWLWATSPFDGSSQQLRYSDYGGGAWGAPQTFWDTTIDPLVPSYANSLELLSLDLSPTPGTLAIACPIGGGAATVGVPYNSGPPIVTGNPTLPLTFSLLSGSLPPGMTLNPATGEVSGTTFVVGTYSYTLEVTDSSSPPLSAMVTEPCSIPVTGGASTLPCANITPHPGTDVQWKLIKVMATFVPARHLPTRGSVR